MLKLLHTWLARLLLLSLLVTGGYGNALALSVADCPMATEGHHHALSHADSGCIHDAGGAACDECPLCPLHSLPPMMVLVTQPPASAPSIIKTPYLSPDFEHLARLELPPPRPHLS